MLCQPLACCGLAQTSQVDTYRDKLKLLYKNQQN